MTAYVALPAQSTNIIGRERKTDELRQLLLAKGVRMLTLTGPGGIGKTRLAVHIASLLAGSFDDGALFVPLAHIAQPELVLIAIAHLLDIKIEGTASVRDSLFSFLHTRRMLLVLDNFEQIVDAAPDVAAMLAECPGITVVVTSRIVLHVRGEHEFPVPPLALPSANAAAEADSLSQYAAVLLFIQRATAVRPDFQLTNANAPAVAEICSRLDGLPLAIELAAARVKILTPQAMLPRLNNRLQLLKGGAVDLPERQQTLRNTIAWSYELLEETEQDLFRKLAVFQGYWNLEAAEAICGDGEDILEGVQSLVDKSMVQQRELAGGEQYFILLETLREFAWEHLQAAGDTAALQAHHADYYLALAESHEEENADELFSQWFATIEQSFGNVRTAFHFFRNTGRWEDAGRLFVALQEYWYARSISGETMVWLEHLLPRMQDMSIYVRSAVYNLAGYFLRDRGDTPTAISYYREVERLLEGTEHRRLLDFALNNLGVSLALAGELDEANRIYEEILPRLRESSDTIGAAKTMLHYAYICERSNRADKAIELLEEAIARLRIKGLLRRTSINLATLANLYAPSDGAKARRLAEEALAICQHFSNRPSEIRALLVLSNIAMSEKEFAEAGQHLLRGLRVARDSDSTRTLIPIMLHFTDLFRMVEAHEPTIVSFAAASTLMRDFMAEYQIAFGAAHEEEKQDLRRWVGDEMFDRVWQQIAPLSIAHVAPLIQQALNKHIPTATIVPVPETPVAAPLVAQTPEPSIPESLTGREVETLRLLAQGLSNKEIADKLFISERTVHAHVRSIYSKLDLTSRSAATRFAVENGIV